MTLDIESNRNATKYTKKILLSRVLWMLAMPLFRYSLRPMHRWRCMLLKWFGAKIGHNVHIYPSARIQFPWCLEIGNYSAIGENAQIYNLGKLTIGARVTVSQNAHLCGGSHDYESPSMTLLKLPITIGDDVWICADAFLGPGTTIGSGAIVGARAVVTKDVAAWAVVVGNPAKIIKSRKMSLNEKPTHGKGC
jgi:putative colanic acid biosynthesis acetyltransferase WcaF